MQLSNLLRKLALSFVLCMVFSLSAQADPINIVGSSTGALSTAVVSFSFDAGTNTLTFTINNTSPFDARITGIGFDLPPVGNASSSGLSFTGNVSFQPAGVDFYFSDGAVGNVPQYNGSVLDFAFLTGNSGDFSGGHPNDGLPPGIDPGDEATFVVQGAGFAGLTEQQILNAIYVRFQRVGADGEGSDVGIPEDPGTPVPEPASMFLLGSGLAGVAGVARRKLKARKQN